MQIQERNQAELEPRTIGPPPGPYRLRSNRPEMVPPRPTTFAFYRIYINRIQLWLVKTFGWSIMKDKSDPQYPSAMYPATKGPIIAPIDTNEPIHDFSSSVIILPNGLSSVEFRSRGKTGLVHPNIAPAETVQRLAEIRKRLDERNFHNTRWKANRREAFQYAYEYRLASFQSTGVQRRRIGENKAPWKRR